MKLKISFARCELSFLFLLTTIPFQQHAIQNVTTTWRRKEPRKFICVCVGACVHVKKKRDNCGNIVSVVK